MNKTLAVVAATGFLVVGCGGEKIPPGPGFAPGDCGSRRRCGNELLVRHQRRVRHDVLLHRPQQRRGRRDRYPEPHGDEPDHRDRRQCLCGRQGVERRLRSRRPHRRRHAALCRRRQLGQGDRSGEQADRQDDHGRHRQRPGRRILLRRRARALHGLDARGTDAVCVVHRSGDPDRGGYGHLHRLGRRAFGRSRAVPLRPGTDTFYVNNDGTTANPHGELDALPGAAIRAIAAGATVNYTALAGVHAYSEGNCDPTGLALGPGTDIAVGCREGTTAAPLLVQILNRSTGAIVASVNAGGGDQIEYDASNEPLLQRREPLDRVRHGGRRGRVQRRFAVHAGARHHRRDHARGRRSYADRQQRPLGGSRFGIWSGIHADFLGGSSCGLRKLRRQRLQRRWRGGVRDPVMSCALESGPRVATYRRIQRQAAPRPSQGLPQESSVAARARSISSRVGRSAPRREQVRLAAVQAKRSVAFSSRSVIKASASRRSARVLPSHASKAA